MESNDLSGLIGKIFENPEAMSSIMSIAEGLKGGDEPASSILPASLPHSDNSIGNLLQLLTALKPYLGEKKRKNIDDVVKVMKLVEVGQHSGILKDLL